MPELIEFRVTIVAAVVCYVMKVVTDYLAYPYYYRLTEFEKNDEMRNILTRKLTDKIYSFTYHVLVITYGFVVLSQTEYFPKMLGGSGANNYEKLWSEFPCIKTGGYEKSLRMYYLITLGYRVFKTYYLIYQWLRNEHRSDFIEMFLHHTLTIALYVFSFMIGWTKVGSIIMFCHDLVEPVLNGTKILVETKANKNLTVVSVIALWVVWFYSRLVVFPQLLYVGFYLEKEKQLYPNYKIENHLDQKRFKANSWALDCMIVFLCFLQVLHIYWLLLLTKMIHKMATKGEMKDIQEETESKKKKN